MKKLLTVTLISASFAITLNNMEAANRRNKQPLTPEELQAAEERRQKMLAAIQRREAEQSAINTTQQQEQEIQEEVIIAPDSTKAHEETNQIIQEEVQNTPQDKEVENTASLENLLALELEKAKSAQTKLTELENEHKQVEDLENIIQEVHQNLIQSNNDDQNPNKEIQNIIQDKEIESTSSLENERKQVEDLENIIQEVQNQPNDVENFIQASKALQQRQAELKDNQKQTDDIITAAKQQAYDDFLQRQALLLQEQEAEEALKKQLAELQDQSKQADDDLLQQLPTNNPSQTNNDQQASTPPTISAYEKAEAWVKNNPWHATALGVSSATLVFLVADYMIRGEDSYLGRAYAWVAAKFKKKSPAQELLALKITAHENQITETIESSENQTI